MRRAQEAEAGSIVVLDPQGQTSAVVNEAAVQATPEDRRPWLPVSSVARTLEPGLSLPVDIAGEQLIRAMQQTPASEYLLLDPDGALFGVALGTVLSLLGSVGASLLGFFIGRRSQRWIARLVTPAEAREYRRLLRRRLIGRPARPALLSALPQDR